MNTATSSPRSAASSASRSSNGTLENPGRSGPNRSLNTASPAAESEPSVSPWKPCSLSRSEEHTSELQSRRDLVCRLLLEKKKKKEEKNKEDTTKRINNHARS